MKIRKGFVSNSSSSSFVIALSKITPEELEKVLAYNDMEENTDHWEISVDEEAGLVRGSTVCDNCAITDYFEEIGINKARWE